MEEINNQKVNAIIISKEDNKITVNISVDLKSEGEKEVRITNKEVLDYLRYSKNISVGLCLQSSVLCNTSNNSLFGTWVYETITNDLIKDNTSSEILDDVIKVIKKKKSSKKED